MNKYLTSRNIVFLLSFILITVHLYLHYFNYLNWNNALGWDIFAYYMYLPFTFLHGDPGMSNQEVVSYIFNNYNPSPTFYQAHPLPNGNWSPMYSMGMSFFYLPFFLIAHIWALLSSYPADGFSYPYRFVISNGMMIYLISGIFLLRKVLLKFFNESVTIITLILIVLGTNYFHEAAVNELAPNSLLFAMFSLMLYLNMKWHDKPTFKNSFWLGLLFGLMLLVRASSLPVILVPVLWGVYNKETFNNKILFIKTHYKKILVLIGGFFVFPIIQMIYWKAITGSFIYNPYQVTPGFNWLGPQFMNILFSYKKGWFIYTPIMMFAILGLISLYKQKKEIFFSIASFIFLFTYMIACWGTWWGGGSFGQRYFLETYAILAIPLGFFINWVYSKKAIFQSYMFLFLFLLAALNIFQTWQFNNWIFDGYSMTKEYYWKIFLKTKVSDEDRKYRDIIRDFTGEDPFVNQHEYVSRTVGYLDFDNINTIYFDPSLRDTTVYLSPPYSAKITPEITYGPTFKFPFNYLTKKTHVWLEISLSYYITHDLKEAPFSIVAVLDHNKGQYYEHYKGWNIEDFPYEVNQWNTVTLYYLTPDPLSRKYDVVMVYPYLRGNQTIYIDNFHIKAWELNR